MSRWDDRNSAREVAEAGRDRGGEIAFPWGPRALAGKGPVEGDPEWVMAVGAAVATVATAGEVPVGPVEVGEDAGVPFE